MMQYSIPTPKEQTGSINWIVDSGATITCTNRPDAITMPYDNHKNVDVRVADGRTVRALAIGSMVTKLRDEFGTLHSVTLHNVVYHPNFANLLSVRQLWRYNRMRSTFGDKCILYQVDTGVTFPFNYTRGYTTCSAMSAHLTNDQIHSRFGHVSERRLRKLAEICGDEKLAELLRNYKHDSATCKGCRAGKARKQAFPKRVNRNYSYFGEKLSSDLCGPFPKSIDGYRYLLNVVDAYTGELWIHPLRTKLSEDVRNAFNRFLDDNRPYLSHGKPIRWHTDNGGEFISHDLDDFCREFAVIRSYSVPFAPPQNAQAERMWGVILSNIRVMLAESGVHESFWTYAAEHACYLHNILPNARLAGESSPFQAKHGKTPDISKVRTWGCMCWYYLRDDERRSKISPRAVPAIHLGRDPERNGYLLYIPSLHKITTAYHVTFQEDKFVEFTPQGVTNIPHRAQPLRDVTRLYREPRDTEHNDNPRRVDNDEHEHSDRDDNDNDTQPILRDDAPPRCRATGCTKPAHSPDEPHSFEEVETRNGGRSTRHQHRRNDADLVVMLDDVSKQLMAVRTEDLLTDIVTPNSYSQAMKSKEKERWIESMNKEHTDLLKHDTWEAIPRNKVPANRKITKSKWVYKVKLNRDGSIERFKSRFVVCGYSQVKGVDFEHSFSATMRATSLRTLIALSAGERLKLEHFDVTSAFTQSDIDFDVYIDPPLGYPQYEGKVLKLRKSLYGTKQASRMWQMKLRSKLIEMGFKNSTHDPCLFSKREGKDVMLIGVYVDDIILAHNNDKLLRWFTDEFCGPKGFNAKHVGKLSWFLGMEIDQSDDYSIKLNQRQYIDKMIERFVPMTKSSVIKHSAPCNPISFQELSTAANDADRDKAKRLPYLQLIGSLLYLSTMTRPDIAYHMSILCSFMHDPSPACYHAAIDLLLYVVQTRDQSLNFSGSTRVPGGVDSSMHSRISANGGLIAYSDSSWRRPDKLGYNSFGYVVYLFGAPVSFASKRLKVIALSSAEAEYAAAAYACREIEFVRHILSDLGFSLSGPTVLAVDNQAAIKIAENMGVTGRTKHFSDAIHYFRHVVEHRVVVPIFVRTNNQHADGFTKALGKGPFKSWQQLLYRS